MKNNISKLLHSWLLCSFLVTLVYAQDDNLEDENVFLLSPFEVNTSGDEGYLAANTLAGTRLNARLKDVPASVSVFNIEFLEDADLLDTIEAIEYSVTFTQDVSSNNGNAFQTNDVNVRARGFSNSSFASRDFFRFFIRSNSYNSERFTFSRGPNSVLFGNGNPGGIINSVTKRAFFRDAGSVDLRVDEFGSFRVAADYNRVIIEDKFAVRVNLLKDDVKTSRDNEYENQRRYHIATTFNPFKSTEIRIDYENGDADRLIQRRWTVRDGFADWMDAGMPSLNHNDFLTDGVLNTNAARTFAFANGGNFETRPTPVIIDDGQNRTVFNKQYSTMSVGSNDLWKEFDVFGKDTGLAGPVNTSDYEFDVFTAYLEQQIGEDFFIELAYNEQTDERRRNNMINHAQIRAHVDFNETLPDGSSNPNFGRYFIEGPPELVPVEREGEILRVTASYELDTGSKWFGRHQIAGLYQDEEINSRAKRYRLANTTPLIASRNRVNQNRIFGRTYIEAGDQPGANGFQFNPAVSPVEPFDLRDPVTGAVVGRVTPEWILERDRPRFEKTESMMVAGQSYFLDDRFAITWGYREDELTQASFVEQRASNTFAQQNPGTLRDTILDTGLGEASTFKGDTTTLGTVVSPLSWLSFSANYSKNFQPQASFDLFNQNIGNVEGIGRDYSARFELMEGKIYANITYFKTEAVNDASNAFFVFTRINEIWETLQVNDIVNDPPFVVEGASDVDNFEAKGWEFEIVANPTPNITLRWNFADADNVSSAVEPGLRDYLEDNLSLWNQHRNLEIPDGGGTTVGDRIDQLVDRNTGNQLAAGQQSEGHVPIRSNFFAKYTFLDGRFKGFDVGVGGRYRDGQYTGYFSDNGVTRAARGDSFFLFDLAFGFKRAIFDDKIDMRVRMNVKNLFDEQDIIITEADNLGLPDDYVLQAPREISVSASFDF